MPSIEHNDSYEGSESLVVDRALLQEVIDVAGVAGWHLVDLKVGLKGTRHSRLERLTDLSGLASYLLETVRKVEITFTRENEEENIDEEEEEKGLAQLTIRAYSSWSIAESVNFWVISTDEGAMLSLKGGLVALLEQRKQWYSFININSGKLFDLTTWASIGSLGYMFLSSHYPHLPSLHYRWLNLFYLACIANLFFIRFRTHLFPSVEFNLTDPPAKKTPSAKVRKQAWKILAAIGVALLALFATIVSKQL